MQALLQRNRGLVAIVATRLPARGVGQQRTKTDKQEVRRSANNPVENSHPQFRRRERAMLRFRQMDRPPKFASVHANLHNQFKLDRRLTDRQSYKEARSAALAE